ncbi:MAG TPA: helix-turn-helix domain-containing protein [Hyphomicrobiaceae bacterium]|nr:helix-turn-helix domain-containing protein [Hyphomicrobiaceae bacterium]
MVTTSGPLRSHCPINFGLEIFGDKWTLLVLRDLLLKGKRSFKEFQSSEEGIASNILAERLARLERTGLVTSARVESDSRQIHYLPTTDCRALLPLLVEMAYWGARHDPRTAAPEDFVQAYERDRDALVLAMAEVGAQSAGAAQSVRE